MNAATNLVRVFVIGHCDHRAASLLQHLPRRTQMLALLLLSA